MPYRSNSFQPSTIRPFTTREIPIAPTEIGLFVAGMPNAFPACVPRNVIRHATRWVALSICPGVRGRPDYLRTVAAVCPQRNLRASSSTVGCVLICLPFS